GNILVQGTGADNGLYLFGSANEVYGMAFSGFATGLFLSNDDNLVVGDPGRGNQFISNTNYGLRIQGGSGTIQANEIGTDATATADLGNGVAATDAGILLSVTNGPVTIGGFGAGEANIIAFNPNGVSDLTSGQPVSIIGNTFTCNSNAGILQAIPSGNPVINSPDFTVVSGSGPANSTIHLYTVNTSACIGTPPCQGYSFLGSAASDGVGNWSIPGTFTLGEQITATATSAAGNTSQFSLCAIVDVVLGQELISLQLEGDLLSWEPSSATWQAFEIQQLADQQIILSQLLTASDRQWPTQGAGEYRIRGLLLDGREIFSNTVIMTPGPDWVLTTEAQELHLGLAGHAWQGKIYDLHGRLIWEGSATGIQNILLPQTGMYVVKMNDETGNAYSSKVLIP
ncbi:MAG: hypothetical protein NWR72_18285, partial [Bacteroidia bacterium]|nr:hypothetical protein [Bacteroidia bacterium]